MRQLAWSALLPFFIAATAFAQTPPAQQSPSPAPQQSPSAAPQQQQGGQNASQNAAQIQDHVRKNLEQAGFTDIKMMPSSFLVRAKDREGNPVMMVINPDSIASVTLQRGSSTTGQGGSSTTGQGGSNQQTPPPPAGGSNQSPGPSR